jgi:hypothetical protein
LLMVCRRARLIGSERRQHSERKGEEVHKQEADRDT